MPCAAASSDADGFGEDSNADDTDFDSPSRNIFAFGKKTLGNVTGKMASLQHRIENVVGDTFEKVTDQFEIFDHLQVEIYEYVCSRVSFIQLSNIGMLLDLMCEWTTELALNPKPKT